MNEVVENNPKKTNIKKKNNISKYIKKLKKYLTKTNITYLVILLLDIILTIYLARQNMVNYAVVLDEEIFVSKTRYLLLGRNYINLITTSFFYIYLCLVNKFFLHNKSTKKFLLYSLLLLTIINITLFIIFTQKIY